MRFVIRLTRSAGLAAICGGLGCGKVSDANPDGAIPIPPNSSIVELTVTPSSSALQWPSTQKATAMAKYDDGTSRDVSAAATWSSSDVTVASVSAGAIASEGVGSAFIRAALGDHQATTNVSVTVPTLAVLSYDGQLAGNIAGIDFFPANATGNKPPLRSIRGAATGLGFRPYGMAVHGQELFVSSGDATPGMFVFPVTGAGNMAPTRHLTGDLTDLKSTIAFSVSDTEIVATGTDAVVVFPTNADGNVAPKRKISGSATQLNSVLSAVVAGSEIYVAEFADKRIAVFAATAAGNTPPIRTISDATATINNPICARVYNDELYVISGGRSIDVLPASASGSVAPIRSIRGPATKLSGAHVLNFAAEKLFVANGDNSVLVFQTTDNGDVAPQRILSGPATHINRPTGIVFF